MAQNFDFVIIGAGIVGLTVAAELRKRQPAARVAVLEKESDPGAHASGRNSGVMHSGIYYGSDTLKAKVCATGGRRMVEFARAEGIAVNPSGKVILATSEKQLPTIERLMRNARENEIPAERIDQQQLKALEPFAAPGAAAIYCPTTAVIDSSAILFRLKEKLEHQGVRFLFGCKARGPLQRSKLNTTQGDVGYGFLFNCAGAYADTIAKQFGLAQEFALVPFKGIYWKLSLAANHKVRANIYPVPDIDMPFLGVHLTRVISGDVYVGPTAIPAFGRENYGWLQGINLAESLDIGYQIAGMYLNNEDNFRKLVHAEMSKYWKRNFLNAARKLVPSLLAKEMVPTKKAGIRPQLVNTKTSRLEMDYILTTTDDSLHVLNAISPAFTSAFAFAEVIVDRAQIH
ncbi:L-2-hydroxyglutarate oxidase [Candidatus Thiosymbion oneisti]|uniref:L-2-hydroxyglutarate oxidase n=1 Tax=Candidatus Thiosymbion oneisti TaxID=589554 RepID=UPI000A8C0E1C|nr:L-2-hydroxyglutarate oxidase [Candidatus Thiosymbion oneisti]